MTTHYSPPPRNQTPGASGDRRSVPLWSGLLMSLIAAVIGGVIAVSLVSTDALRTEEQQDEALGRLFMLTGQLLGDIDGLETRLLPVQDAGRRLMELERRADGLARDIADLSSEMDGLGLSGALMPISGYRVDAPLGCSGRPAVWVSFGGGLGC